MTFLPSRSWFAVLAMDYGTRLGIATDQASRNAAALAAQDACRLLNNAPWHFRLLVGGVEIVASVWCLGYRLAHLQQSDRLAEIAAFEKVPVISLPLLRLYRSLVALSWFEQPAALNALGITQTPDMRQEEFRKIRQAS